MRLKAIRAEVGLGLRPILEHDAGVGLGLRPMLEHDVIGKSLKVSEQTGSVLHPVHQLHAQCLVCMTVFPPSPTA